MGSKTVAAQIAPAASCAYVLVLTDAMNNGWDGASIDVSIDGAPAVNYTVANGASPMTIDLAVNNGSTIDLNYHVGAFENEHSFMLFNVEQSMVYNSGTQPTSGVLPTIKAECPLTCTGTEDYTIVLTLGDDPEEISWELTDTDGDRIAFANPNTFIGLSAGTAIEIPISLDACEAYTFTAYDGGGDGWEGGFWQILSMNPNRGQLIMTGDYMDWYEIATGSGSMANGSALSTAFTLPCLECPGDELEFATDGCQYTNYVFPAGNVPTPVICYPDVNGHGNPPPVVYISYPTAMPAVANVATGTAVNLPVGENPVVFTVIYNDFQIIRCTTNVDVVTSLNPTLICNDNVKVSLNDLDGIDNDDNGSLIDDEGECVLEIRPDMVLEAPTICDGEYTVTVFDINGDDNGPWVDATMVGHTLTYKVEHIASNNICWGTLTVEDKLAPHIECVDYTITCNHPHALNEFYTNIASYTPEAGTLPANIAGGAAFSESIAIVEFELPCGPLGEYLRDVDIAVDIAHTEIGDLKIELIAPDGTTILLMDHDNCPDGGSHNMTVLFDDDATDEITGSCMPLQMPAINGVYQPVDMLSVFSNTLLADYSGVWQLKITDDNNTPFPDGEVGIGELVSAELLITSGFPHPYEAYDCSEVEVELISEMINETNCSVPWIGSEIVRVWRASDIHGNASICTQTVSLRTPTFDDIDVPTNVDLECGVDPVFENTGFPTFDCYDLGEDYHSLCDLSYTYEDTEVPTCGNGKKIIREWTIVNWCASTTKEFNQVIKISDNEGPIISGDDIIVSAAAYSCDADVLLSTFVEDACSDVTQITASYIAGGGAYTNDLGNLQIVDITNSGTLQDLPEGDTEVVILAKDACGNSSIDTILITVLDDVPPAPICDDDLHVTLNGTGTARIYAQDIDEGSFDNCGIASLQARRIDGCLGTSLFADYVDFACCDASEEVTVELRVTDYNGNSSICWLPIQIEDKLPPIITCPTDKTISCTDTYNNLSQFGNATAVDNCEVEVELVEEEDIDNCGAGTIHRTWTATDVSGNQNICTQRITLLHESDYTIQFPEDVSIESCSDEIGDTGQPLISGDDCELIAISHEDQVFDIVPDACFKIIRTWTVINWCIYDLDGEHTNLGHELAAERAYQDDGDGYFQYTQIIKVFDTTPPVIDPNTVADITIEITGDCAIPYELPIGNAVDDCAGIIEATPSQSSLFGTPGDEFEINYHAEDGCGNDDWVTITVTFIDAKKPTPVCINGLATELMVTGEVTLWANDFEAGSSFDNCTAYEDLRFSFSPDIAHTSQTFNCSQLGTQIVELWVTDEDGNQDFCSTYVIIQDNMNVCDDANTGGGTNAQIAIGGSIVDEKGEEIQDVTVSIEGNNAIPYITGVNGNYAFPDLSMYGNYTVRPEKDMDYVNGISTYDLVLLSQHILGIAPLESPFKIIAADANQSGNLTTFDILLFRQLVLYVIDELPSNSSWKFVDANYGFSNPNDPFADDFPEAIDLASLDQDELEANFVGIKIGDLNNSAAANNLSVAQERNANGTLTFGVDDQTLEAGKTYTVDFLAKDFNTILGYQFTLNFDTDVVDFEGVESAALPVIADNFGLHLLDEGVITTSWHTNEEMTVADDAILFSLVFTAKATTSWSEVLGLNSRYTTAEAYAKNNDAIDLKELALEFITAQGSTVVGGDFELYQNQPNPFNHTTLIGFHLPQASKATLSIFDLSGKLLKVVSGEYSNGYNEITIDKADLSASGILYYQLETPNATATKKMIIVE